MLRLVTLLWLASTVFGVPFEGDERIVGGEDAVIKDHPYQLSLHIGGFFECGAVIISPLWALTAAQCAGGTIANMQLRAGSKNKDTQGTLHSVTQKVVHLNFDLATKDFDIALLKVEPPFTFVDNILMHIQPVALPEQTTEVDGEVTVTGWGLTMAGGDGAKSLMSVIVPVVDINECKIKYGASLITDQMLCAGEAGKDACQGDTGGPLVVKDAADPKSDLLVGLVSWGRGCAIEAYPHVYSKVAAFRNWILTNSGV